MPNRQNPPSKTLFVVQVQEKKNGKWEDDQDYGYNPKMNDDGTFNSKTDALSALKRTREDTIESAKDEYDNPPLLRGSAYETFTVKEGTDLDEIVDKVKEAHKKFNPTKPKKRKPFNPDDVWPKFRVIARTYLDEPLEA